MNSQTTPNHTTGAASEIAIRAVIQRMVDAWNEGSGEVFAAPFGETADFIAFEGTHLKGRQEIISFHRQIFDTAAKGTRLEGEVKFVHILNPQLAVMHSAFRMTLPGQTEPSPSRDSMQLFVVTKRDADWRVEAMLNARLLTVERQLLLDDSDGLPAAAQRQVADYGQISSSVTKQGKD